MYFPRNWELGSALSKLRNFGGLNPPNHLPRYATDCFKNKKLHAWNLLHSHGPTVKESSRTCTHYSYFSARYKIAWTGFASSCLWLVLFPCCEMSYPLLIEGQTFANRAAMAQGLLSVACIAPRRFLRATSHDQTGLTSKAVIHLIVLAGISSTLAP
jgi:hypothetical protein